MAQRGARPSLSFQAVRMLLVMALCCADEERKRDGRKETL
jgi:hypothetical protein